MFEMVNYSVKVVLLIQIIVICAKADNCQDEILKQFESLQAEVQRLRHMESKVQTLESEVRNLRHFQLKVKSLELDFQGIKDLKSEVKFLRQDNKELLDKLNEINSTQKNGVNKYGNTEKPHENKETKRLIGNDIIPDLANPTTAFSAVLTPKFDRNIGQLHVFVYDHVESNIGGAYSNNTGAFTAQKPGVYAFLWTIVAEGQQSGTAGYGEVGTELLVNSIVRGRAFTDTEVSSDDDQATGFVIVQLNKGDVVFVRSTNQFGAEGVFQKYRHGGWTFSGWQIA